MNPTYYFDVLPDGLRRMVCVYYNEIELKFIDQTHLNKKRAYKKLTRDAVRGLAATNFLFFAWQQAQGVAPMVDPFAIPPEGYFKPWTPQQVYICGDSERRAWRITRLSSKKYEWKRKLENYPGPRLIQHNRRYENKCFIMGRLPHYNNPNHDYKQAELDHRLEWDMKLYIERGHKWS